MVYPAECISVHPVTVFWFKISGALDICSLFFQIGMNVMVFIILVEGYMYNHTLTKPSLGLELGNGFSLQNTQKRFG